MSLSLGIFARTFPRTSAAEVADALVEAGYGVTQLNLASFGYPTVPSPGTSPRFADVKEAFAKRGVDIWGLSATYNVIDRSLQETTKNAVELIRRSPELGTQVVTLCTGTRDATNIWHAHPDNSTPEAWRDLRATLDQLIPAAAEANVRLGIEPEPGNVIRDAAAAEKLLRELGDDAAHLGIVLDPANLVTPDTLDRQKHILTEAFQNLGAHTVAVHAKDVVGPGQYAAAGQGGLDYALIAGLHLALPHQVPVIVQDTTEEDAPAVRAFLEEQWAAAGAGNVSSQH